MDRTASTVTGRRRPNLKDEAAKYLRDRILSGKLRPGEKVDQDAIAEELGISRLPVREALILLDAEGLIDNVARRGSFVAQLTPADFRDHYEMYGVLSGLAAKRAAATVDEEFLERLEKIQAEFEATDDPHREDELNFEFHQAINRAGRSKRLTAVLRLLSKNMPTHFFEFHREWEPVSIDEHRNIIEALRGRDGDAAFQMVYDHFASVGGQAVNQLRSSGYWDDLEEE